jgi:hypothetical protein
MALRWDNGRNYYVDPEFPSKHFEQGTPVLVKENKRIDRSLSLLEKYNSDSCVLDFL